MLTRLNWVGSSGIIELTNIWYDLSDLERNPAYQNKRKLKAFNITTLRWSTGKCFTSSTQALDIWCCIFIKKICKSDNQTGHLYDPLSDVDPLKVKKAKYQQSSSLSEALFLTCRLSVCRLSVVARFTLHKIITIVNVNCLCRDFKFRSIELSFIS